MIFHLFADAVTPRRLLAPPFAANGENAEENCRSPGGNSHLENRTDFSARRNVLSNAALSGCTFLQQGALLQLRPHLLQLLLLLVLLLLLLQLSTSHRHYRSAT